MMHLAPSEPNAMTLIIHERLRCPNCHEWPDAMLVWASGNCCPCCNEPIDEDAYPGRGLTDQSKMIPSLEVGELGRVSARRVGSSGIR